MTSVPRGIKSRLTCAWLAGAAALASPGVAHAAAGPATNAAAMLSLAKASGCLACHAMRHKKVGPAYAAIAARYAGNAKALDILQNAILNGHVGTWGVIPMPAYGGSQQDLTPDQARQLAQWIMGMRAQA